MKFPLLGYAAVVSFSFPAIVGVVKWNRLNKQMKLFACYCVIAAILTGIEFIFAKIGMRNHRIINVNHLVELLTLNLFYYYTVHDTSIRKLIVWSGIIFTVYWICGNVLFATTDSINEVTAIVSRLLIIINSIAIITVRFSNTDVSLLDSSVFCIGSAVILYCTGSIFILGFSNTLLRANLDYFVALWSINWVLIIISNLFFSKSFSQKYL